MMAELRPALAKLESVEYSVVHSLRGDHPMLCHALARKVGCVI